MIRRAAVLALICLLAACGSSSRRSGIVAEVGAQRISPRQLDTSVNYALSFYAWAYGTGVGLSGPKCTRKSRDAACIRVRHQVLRRMLEELVIGKYASQHHIALSADERARIQGQVGDLSHNDTTVSQLLSEHRISKRFLQSLLRVEALVRKVEYSVTREQAQSGDAYHLRRFRVTVTSSSQRAQSYQKALDLATDGKPIPPGTRISTQWIAPFRLESRLRGALLAATPGQFLGPFKTSHGYLVVQYLARGVHRYGRPARLALQTQVFHDWLSNMMQQAHVRCYDGAGEASQCRATEH